MAKLREAPRALMALYVLRQRSHKGVIVMSKTQSKAVTPLFNVNVIVTLQKWLSPSS